MILIIAITAMVLFYDTKKSEGFKQQKTSLEKRSGFSDLDR